MEVRRLRVGSFVRPCDGEAVSGDAIVVKECPDGVFLSLIDVLGHGRDAAEVALHAIRFLKQHAGSDVASVLSDLNEHLSGTRGAMGAIAFADSASGTIRCAGVGNPLIRRVGKREESYPSPDGIIGVRFRTPRVRELRLEPDEMLLVCSDGVEDGAASALARAVVGQSVDAIARRIVLDHGRTYDDASCLIARYEP